MFAKATSSFVKQIESSGDLIPVRSLNDSDKLQLLSLVTKRKKGWFWQKPKYHTTSFSLQDILTGDIPIKAEVTESDFLKYEGKFGDSMEADTRAEVANLSFSLEGQDSVALESSFGNLKKQELDLHQLLKIAETRVIHLDHSLVQQTCEKRNEILCVVNEKVITSQKCSISEHLQIEEKCGGTLGLKTKILKVAANDDGTVTKDINVVLEIPPCTVIAYSVTELFIKQNGQFEICLLSDKCGGFDKILLGKNKKEFSSTISSSLTCVDGASKGQEHVVMMDVPSEASLSALKPAIDEASHQFQPFTELSEETSHQLFKLCCEFLYHEDVISLLENILEKLSSAEEPTLTGLQELESTQAQKVTDLLHILGYDGPNNDGPSKNEDAPGPELFTAAFCLFTAMDGMSEENLAVLGICCEIQILPTLLYLINNIPDGGMLPVDNPDLHLLKEEDQFYIAQRLFALSNVCLEKTESSIKVLTDKQPGMLPVNLVSLSEFWNAAKSSQVEKMESWIAGSEIVILEEDITVGNVIDQKINEQMDRDLTDAFIIVDLGALVDQHLRWQRALPRVKPFYAVKCNSSKPVVQILAQMGMGFDCASKNEIALIRDIGVAGERIVYANPCKESSHIKYAASRGVQLLTFDNEDELNKVAMNHPAAKLVLRIATNYSATQISLSEKFGATISECGHLMECAAALKLDIIGVSFHIGSGCTELEHFTRAIADARIVFDMGIHLGFHMGVLDIGGGFPGSRNEKVIFEEMRPDLRFSSIFSFVQLLLGVKYPFLPGHKLQNSWAFSPSFRTYIGVTRPSKLALTAVINPALDIYFPEGNGVKIIAEPGRYYVTSSFTLAVNIIARRIITNSQSSSNDEAENNKTIMYYINDGLYGSFDNVSQFRDLLKPILYKKDIPDQKLYRTMVWGPTCDAFDYITDIWKLPELKIGNWLLLQNVGAYTVSTLTTFNGFDGPTAHYVISKKAWETVQKIKKGTESPE